MQKRKRLKELIEGQRKGLLSVSEQQVLDKFLRKEYQGSTWDEKTMGDKTLVSEAILRTIKARVIKPPFMTRYKYPIAASIALMMSISIYFLSAGGKAESLIFHTASSADSLKLADGSMVYLAANSTLQYPAEFNQHQRLVHLEKGDAFFKVEKDPKHPFVVSTTHVRTKVLGTSFHISLEQSECRVTVVSGKVNVSSGTQNFDLLPKQEAFYSNRRMRKQKQHENFINNWFSKDIEMNNVPLSRVLTILNYKHGVKFRASQNEVLDTKITLYLKAELSLTEILDQINYITNLKFSAHDKTIDISR